MATRIPLVLALDGQLEQLPTADDIIVGKTNIGTVDIVIAANTVSVIPSNVKFLHLGGGVQNVDTINGGVDGDILYIRLAPGSNNVRVRKNNGNVTAGPNRRLNSQSDLLVLLNDSGTSWVEISWRG
jgi:hypothetical protein